VTFKNPAGGRGLILPYHLPAEFMPHGWARKEWFDRWLEELAGGVAVPYVADGPWVHLAARSGPSHKTLFMATQMFDVYDKIHVRLPKAFAAVEWRAEFHSRDKAAKVCRNDQILAIETELVGNDWLVLKGK
jgi:hypothetical protein